MDLSPSTEDTLRNSPLFFPLDSTLLKEVLQIGQTVSFRQGETISADSKKLGFLNLIASGKLRIKRKHLPNKDKIDELPDGYSFGGIDQYLGVGEFCSALVLLDSTIFILSKENFENLCERCPKFRIHITGLRKHNLSSPQEENKTSSPQGVRKDPRLEVPEGAIKIFLSDGSIRVAKDISTTGMFLLGQAPGSLKDKLEFTLISELKEVPAKLTLSATIQRIQEKGFGIQLNTIHQGSANTWNQILTHLAQLEVPKALEPDKVPLASPISTHFIVDQSYLSGSLVALSPKGATLSTNQLPENITEFTLNIKLILPNQNRVMFDTSCKVTAKTDAGYQLSFAELSQIHRNWIQSFLENQENPEEEDLSVDLSPIIEQIDIASSSEFSKLYLRELRNNVIILPNRYNASVGRPVHTHIRVKKTTLSLSKRPATFRLKGTIKRITSSKKMVVELDSLSEELKNQMKEIAAISASKKERVPELVFSKSTTSQSDSSLGKILGISLLILGILGSWYWSKKKQDQPYIAKFNEERRTMDEAFRMKFLTSLNIEEKTLTTETESFSTKDLLFIRFDPRTKEHTLFLKGDRKVKVTQELAKQFPPKLLNAMLEIDPSSISMVVKEK